MLSLLLLSAAEVPVYALNGGETRDGVGMSVMGFSSYDVTSGKAVDSSILGRTVMTVINEWADWCDPCLAELPLFQEMHEYYMSTPAADVQILGSVYCTANGTTPQSAAYLCRSEGYTWHNVVEDSVLAQVFRTSNMIPQTIVVDRNGVVRAHKIGSFSGTQLRDFIRDWYQILLDEESGSGTGLAGDVNGDGLLDTTDALLVLRYSMSMLTDLPEMGAADVNGDGTVNMTDALLILRAALGIISLN